jgi:hypothetical protein
MEKSKIREYIYWRSYPMVFILMGWFFFVMSINMICKVEGGMIMGIFPIVWYMLFWVGDFFEWASFKVVDLMIYLTGKNLEIKKVVQNGI